MKTIQMPPNFEWGFAGDVELMQESAAAMGLAMMLAVAFIYIVLASQFESFTEPFLIMLSLPLAIVGALLAILLTGNNLGMPAMIGIVMLMGLVTKNAILLIDTTNHYVREGMSVAGGAADRRPDPPAADSHDDDGDDSRHAAVGAGTRRGRRVPRADFDCDDRRPDHLDRADARRRAGGVPAAGSRFLAWLKSFRAESDARGCIRAVRVTGALLLVVLVGWFLSVAGAFAQRLG